MLERFYYAAAIADFELSSIEDILGHLSRNNEFATVEWQRYAWVEEIKILQRELQGLLGHVILEYSIPRMGRRIDAVLIIQGIVFVLEFKIDALTTPSEARDQVWDYALDLKFFHDASAECVVVPIVVGGGLKPGRPTPDFVIHADGVATPMAATSTTIRAVITHVLSNANASQANFGIWKDGRYSPTPTIIEAARALYFGHAVGDISRKDASARNLKETSARIAEIIKYSRDNRRKSICFVTGVPGAGKTLVGLDIASTHMNKEDDLHSVYLSGNGPLVEILREALARDKVARELEHGRKLKKGEAVSAVKSFIQPVHHFRNDCLRDSHPPVEHVAIFDEAQRAWDLRKISMWMKKKTNHANFAISESEFLISCLDRHKDWATVVCLVGGGQEINTGEAGIVEWLAAMERSFPEWDIYMSPRLRDSEYGAEDELEAYRHRLCIKREDALHLSVSMRSFRAEHVSAFVKSMLDLEVDEARRHLQALHGRYPLLVTRSLTRAKEWLRTQARGTERYGLVVSSQAERLRPLAINVKAPMSPVHWFLEGKTDVRSSYYLEDVATEFDVQGLELDWVAVTWDGDFRFRSRGWEHWSFKGSKWQRINVPERRAYLKNAYRVLLTRARQGMIIVVPEGDPDDATRVADYYDPTFEYLTDLGIPVI